MTGFLCGCGNTTSGEEAAWIIKAYPDDTGLFPWRDSILSAFRSDRPHGLFTYGAEYQHSDSSIWGTGGTDRDGKAA